MNYFSPRSAAERYARGRPYFHPVIVGRIKDSLSITERLSSALDVGCGTGLSAIALKDLAQSVTGVDASAEMIALAPKEQGVTYFVAPAENLPFDEKEFDLITLSQVFHWLDRRRFLTEAYRVLRPGGWLIAYDNYFTGQTAGRADRQSWYEEYLERYPMPPRASVTFTPENTNPHGFSLLKEEFYQNTIGFSLEGLVEFLITQTNVIAAVEGGGEKIEDVCSWLRGRLKSVFGDAREREFMFNAPIWCLQRAT
jgi:SAM-dependent methyltransferase